MKHLTNYKLFEHAMAMTPENIYYFIGHGNLDVVKRIVDKYDGNPDTMGGLKHTTPLTCAIERDHFDIAEYLLEKGSNPNFKYGAKKIPLLFLVAQSGNLKLVEKFIKAGAKINAVDGEGSNILFYATHVYTMGGHNKFDTYSYDVMKYFLDKKVNPNKVNKFDVTPMKICITSHKYQEAELLLKYGSDSNFIDKDRESILFYAVSSSATDIATLLIKHGADVTYKKDFYRGSFLDIIDICYNNNQKAWLSRYETQKAIAEKDPGMLLKIEKEFTHQHPDDRPKIDPQIRKEYAYLFTGKDLNLLD